MAHVRVKLFHAIIIKQHVSFCSVSLSFLKLQKRETSTSCAISIYCEYVCDFHLVYRANINQEE